MWPVLCTWTGHIIHLWLCKDWNNKLIHTLFACFTIWCHVCQHDCDDLKMSRRVGTWIGLEKILLFFFSVFLPSSSTLQKVRSCGVQKRDIWEFRCKEERAGILPCSAARGCEYCQPEKGNPRTLRELDRWKATEFRMFLLYTGPVILSSYLDTNIYNNFMLLFSAIAILFSPTLSSLHLQYAEILLQMFVTHFGQV